MLTRSKGDKREKDTGNIIFRFKDAKNTFEIMNRLIIEFEKNIMYLNYLKIKTLYEIKLTGT